MKRLLVVLLLTMTLVTVFSATALAAADYTFTLSAADADSAVAGDEISVTLTLKNNSNADFTMYAMQDYIIYDSDYFSYVTDSVSYAPGLVVSFPALSEEGKEAVRVSYLSTSGTGIDCDATTVLASFKLKVLKTGSTTISHHTEEMSSRGGVLYTTATENAVLNIGSDTPTPGGDGGRDDDEDDEDDEDELPTLQRFLDVPVSYWAYPHIEYLADRGVVTGKTGNLFCPLDRITRAEFVTMLARMSGESLPLYADTFGDVSGGAYYARAVAWAVNAGITKGTSETAFSPNSPILRQEIATMIYRYAQHQQYSFVSVNAPAAFIDQAQIHAYALTAVSVMQQADIINGYEDGSFRPLGYANRAEAAKMLALTDQAIND